MTNWVENEKEALEKGIYWVVYGNGMDFVKRCETFLRRGFIPCPGMAEEAEEGASYSAQAFYHPERFKEMKK